MIGRVVSTKMNHTAAVLVERTAMHPLYKKTFIQTKKYLVDVDNNVKEGDIVEIIKIRPVSKNKHWKVAKVIGQNLAEIVEAKQKEAAEEIIAEVMPEEKTEESSEVSRQTEKVTEKKQKKERKSLIADS
ncbi:30S ribosomal protein S17 [Candidatus Daviesbacteria bacterium]|nr:30S ribosomal protein S17 [Candidatus Daviesbacteria bacterium]